MLAQNEYLKGLEMADNLERLYIPDMSIIQQNQQKRHCSQTQKVTETDRRSKLKRGKVFGKGNEQN